ncbi:MAG TPA: tetratricopeptide repeat protein [Vicinamibacterales bacterium]|nr:tetratricopeptide repeat protein [Vicinamibacterales bacterium]
MEQSTPTNRSVHFGTFDLDLQSGELRKHGLKIRLPNQSFLILERLLERPGEVVSRDELRRTLWPDDTFVDFELGLSSAVKKLRDALGDSAENARFVETLPRRGYRFIGPVVRANDAAIASAPVVAGASTPDLGIDHTKTEPVVESAVVRQRSSLRPSTTLAIFLAVIAGLAIVSFVAMHRRIVAPATPHSIRSIAVLPLANLTGDPGQEYFVDGMTDELITELAQICNARVISRTSIMQYKKAPKPIPVVGQELNVDAIVEGTVTRSGSRVRINTQLIDAHSEGHVWTKGYERDENDIVALQSDVARSIAEAIAGKVTSGRQRARTVSTQVSEEANALLFRAVIRAGGGGYQGFQEAIRYARDAIAKQPDFSAAYGMMAISYVQFSFVGPLRPVDFMPQAETAARKAIELNETNTQAHAALGLVLYRFYWDWEGAEKQLRRALEINPSYAEGHRMLGVFLSAAGRRSEGLTEAQEARTLDPRSDPALLNLAVALRDAGQTEQAISEFRKLVKKRPELGRAHAELGEAYLVHGDLDASLKELLTAVKLSDRNPRSLADLGYAEAVVGHKGEARKILHELNALSLQRFVAPFDLAIIQVGLGRTDEALASLEKACELHDPQLTRLRLDRRLDALRPNGRFRDLERRVGLAR